MHQEGNPALLVIIKVEVPIKEVTALKWDEGERWNSFLCHAQSQTSECGFDFLRKVDRIRNIIRLDLGSKPAKRG